jgi:hypothetical protein
MTTAMLTLLLALGVGGTPPDVYTMRNPNLEIPIRVNEVKRPEIRELELHVSTDQGRTWTLAGRAKPEQQAFGFHASGDGIYWFSVCAIDKTGRRDPEDISTAKPALKVLIDTSHPALQVVAVDRVGEEIQVAWECNDSQADPSSLRLEYRPAGAEPTAVWTPVAVPAQVTGTYRFRPNTTGAITLRMQITDGAGTPATVVRDVAGAAIAAPPPSAAAFAPSPAPAPTPSPQPAPPPPGIQQANSVSPPPAPVAPLGQAPTMVTPQPQQQPQPQPQPQPPVDPTPMPAAPPQLTSPAAPAPMDQTSPSGLAPLHSASEPGPRPSPPTSEFGAPSAHATPTEVQHVKDRTVAIDFDVDRKGPSGVRKIEVYATQDDGQTWVKYSETTNTMPPLQLDLPGKDGLYGFCMVLYSGVGQSEGPPRSGDPPHFKLLVDRTAPQVMLFEPLLDSSQPNALVIRYKAADANLVPNSVALYWKGRPDQPWQPMTASAPHSSDKFPGVQECVWSLPPDVPNSVYLRVTARDQAGNVGEFVTRDPVTVDLNKPIARVKAVVPASYRRP